MASNYRISFTSEAREDYEQIALGLSEITWLPSVIKWADKIANKISSLAVFPEGYPRYDYDDRLRSARVGKYRVIYRVFRKERIVLILRIVYARRDLKKIIG